MRPLTLVELALLPALAWPWARLLLDRRRRLARVAPHAHALLAALLVAAAAAALVAAARAPVALHAAAAGAVALALVGGWRARPAYGRSRRLPPGSLSFSRSIAALVERDFYAVEQRRHGPIFKMAQFHRPVVCVVGLELAHDLLRRHRDRLGPSPLPWNDELRGGFLRYMDGTTHERYGSLFRVALSGPIVAAAEPATRRAARRELQALAAAPAGVAPGPALDRIVLAAFARVLFGVDEETATFAAIARGHAVLRQQSLGAPLTARSRAALEELRALVERQAGELRAGRASGALCACALQELERTAPGLPDGTCVDNLLFILKIATDNVGALLRWLLKLLGEHPEWSGRLRRQLDGEREGSGRPCAAGAGGVGAAPRAPGLADRIVMETLRLEQSEYLYRVVREQFEHGGFVFPTGWQLRVCVRESHRDEEVWADAAAFDPDRFLDPVPRSRYSPFGFHQHACNGIDLNNLICRVTLEELAAGFDWSLSRDGEIERGFRHWSHWRPSADLAITIAARGAPAQP
ncbi:MAG TPA: cytochrome P450 [Thermoanaerobaculia bacterium]|nr:cytochrome P450 [Thermoanaerobaculia bacterium]